MTSDGRRTAMATIAELRKGLLRSRGYTGRRSVFQSEGEAGLFRSIAFEPPKVPPVDYYKLSVHWGVSVRGWLPAMTGGLEVKEPTYPVYCAIHGRPSSIVGRFVGSGKIDWVYFESRKDSAPDAEALRKIEGILLDIVLPHVEGFTCPEDLLTHLQRDARACENQYFGPYSQENRWRTIAAVAHVLDKPELAARADAKATALRP